MRNGVQYHSAVYFPDHIIRWGYNLLADAITGGVSLGVHAAQRMVEKNIHAVFSREFLANAEIFEVTLDESGRANKIAARVHVEGGRDVCFAMYRGGKIATLWTNSDDDQHATLDRSQYVGGVTLRKVSRFGVK